MKRIILFFATFFALFLGAKDFHPYHAGSVEITYNTKSNTFEILTKLYVDDLENALKTEFAKTFKFSDESQKKEIEVFLEKYLAENLKLKINGKAVEIKILGFDEEKGIVNIYSETEKVLEPKKIEAGVSLLYNQFKDQINMVHIIVNGERKSSKLTYPNRYLYQLF
jgi:hypothetical protein